MKNLIKKFVQNIFSVKNNDVHKVVTMFGLKLKIKSQRLKQKIKQRKLDYVINKYKEISENKTIIAYFDHSFGGGTETYFFNKLSELPDNAVLIRIQYYLHNQLYKITFYSPDKKYEVDINFQFLCDFINNITINKIVINNIVGYPKVENILDLISTYKINFPKTEVIVKGHDFYSICPEWNLLDYNDRYCGVKSSDAKCCKCFDKFQIKCEDIKENFSITNWRKMWGEFFKSTVDILEVFSLSSRDIFFQTYPFMIAKIVVNPHKVKPFPKYNIAILGNFQLNKGSKVIENLVGYLEKNEIYDYHFYLIGIIYQKIKSDLVTEIGAYNRNELPNILKNNNIDLVFISSIWPETFSYTSIEVILMDYPAACFNMGGQAEHLKDYDKGLILSSFKPQIIEKEIRTFLESNKINLVKNVKKEELV